MARGHVHTREEIGVVMQAHTMNKYVPPTFFIYVPVLQYSVVQYTDTFLFEFFVPLNVPAPGHLGPHCPFGIVHTREFHLSTLLPRRRGKKDIKGHAIKKIIKRRDKNDKKGDAIKKR